MQAITGKTSTTKKKCYTLNSKQNEAEIMKFERQHYINQVESWLMIGYLEPQDLNKLAGEEYERQQRADNTTGKAEQATNGESDRL